MYRPLATAFIVFMSGILFAHHIKVPLIAVVLLITVVGGLLLIFRKRKIFLSYLLGFLLIFLLANAAYINFNTIPEVHIANLLKDKPVRCSIRGTIVSYPEYYIATYSHRKGSFMLKVKGYKQNGSWTECCGLSKVNIKKAYKDYSYGDEIVVSGELNRPPSATNPGEFDYAGYLKTQKIYVVMTTKSDNDIVLLDKQRPIFIRRFIFEVRKDIESLINKYLRPQDAAILNPMLIGKRSQMPDWLNDYFIKTGTAHILSVSGLHVGILSVIVFFMLRIIRMPRLASIIFLILFLIFYTILAGEKPPIIRASIMIILFFLSYVMERNFDVYSALSAAGLLILTANPMQVFDIGFVLSFACIFSMCYFTPAIEAVLKIPLKFAVLRYLFRTITVSLAVFIGVMPLIAYYFNIISPITVIANLFIVPISGAILFVGILFATLGAIFGQAAFILGNVLHLLLSVSIKIMAFLSSVPFAYFYIPRLPLCAFAAYYLLVLTLSRKNLLKLNWFRIVISGLFIVLTILSTNIFAATDKLRVSFLDIVGGSVFLELPNRKTLLIDAGRDLNSFTHSGRNIVAPFIWSRGRGSIDIAMLAQSDISHQGAMRSVMERISVKYFISGQLKNDNTFYNKTENFMASRKINRIVVKDAIVIDMPDTDIKIYAIKVSVNKKALRKETVLSDQLIIRLVYKDFILLLCPSEIEKYLNEVLVYWPRPQASVIAVQYHRLKQKGRISAQRFYETIRPKVIIVNSKSRKAEKGTDYSDMLAVKNKDSKIFSTDNLGAITIITDGHSYSLESFKPA